DAGNGDHDVVATLSGELRFELGHEREMGCGEGRDAKNMHVILDRLPGCFCGRRKKRPDIDVEAEIGKSRGDHFLTAVVSVLSDLGDEQARAAAFGSLECLDGVADTVAGAGHSGLPLV